MDRGEKRLLATIALLSYGDRLTIVNAVLTSLPTYYMCSPSLPKSVIESIGVCFVHAKNRSLVEIGMI